MMNKIHASYKLSDLTGVGEEWLLDPSTDAVRAVFFDGNLRLPTGGNSDATAVFH